MRVSLDLVLSAELKGTSRAAPESTKSTPGATSSLHKLKSTTEGIPWPRDGLYVPYSHHMPPLRAQPRLGHKGDLACFRLFCLSTKEAHYKPHCHSQIFVMRSPRDPSDFT